MFDGMPSARKHWRKPETRPSKGQDTLDELCSGTSGPLRGLQCSLAELAEILEVSAGLATRVGLAKMEQQELVLFGRSLSSLVFWISY